MVDLRQFLQSHHIDTPRLQPEPGKVRLADDRLIFDVGTQTGFFIGETGRNIDKFVGYGSIPLVEYPDVETIYDRIAVLFQAYIELDYTKPDWEVVPEDIEKVLRELLQFPLAAILAGCDFPDYIREGFSVPFYVSNDVDPNMVFGLCAPEYVGVIVTDSSNKTGLMVHGGVARVFRPAVV